MHVEELRAYARLDSTAYCQRALYYSRKRPGLTCSLQLMTINADSGEATVTQMTVLVMRYLYLERPLQILLA